MKNKRTPNRFLLVVLAVGLATSCLTIFLMWLAQWMGML